MSVTLWSCRRRPPKRGPVTLSHGRHDPEFIVTEVLDTSTASTEEHGPFGVVGEETRQDTIWRGWGG